MVAQEIYCDECGFTGNRLLDEDQPIFTYASIAISNEEATHLVSDLLNTYKPQGNELKGRRLLGNYRGSQIIKHIFEEYSHRISPFKVLFFGTGNNLKSQFSVLGFQLLVKEKKKL